MEKKIKRDCNEDCNNCPIVGHPNSKLLTYLFNKLYDKFGDDLYEIVNETCPNLTVCYNCRVDDFVHVEGCEFLTERED